MYSVNMFAKEKEKKNLKKKANRLIVSTYLYAELFKFMRETQSRLNNLPSL